MVSWCVRWHRCMTVEECKMMQQFPVQQHPRTSEAAISETQQTSHIAPCRCLQVGHYRTQTASGRAHISITGKASMLIPIIIKILNTINKLIDGSICTSLIRILRVKNVVLLLLSCAKSHMLSYLLCKDGQIRIRSPALPLSKASNVTVRP